MNDYRLTKQVNLRLRPMVEQTLRRKSHHAGKSMTDFISELIMYCPTPEELMEITLYRINIDRKIKELKELEERVES